MEETIEGYRSWIKDLEEETQELRRDLEFWKESGEKKDATIADLKEQLEFARRQLGIVREELGKTKAAVSELRHEVKDLKRIDVNAVSDKRVDEGDWHVTGQPMPYEGNDGWG